MNRGPAKKPHETESEWFCSSEWHIAQMRSRLAAPIFGWAHRVSRKSGILHASAQHMALYFRADRKVVLRALNELKQIGFLEIVRVERGKPNVYKIIDHKPWSLAHPGRCVREISYPWKGEGDSLGRHLYSISGGRAKFWPNQMTGLRNLGFTDEEITEEFRRFMATWDYIGSAWDHVYYDFHARLKIQVTRSDVSHRRDTSGRKGVPPKGHAGVPPKGPYSTNRFSDGKSNSSIPAGADVVSQPLILRKIYGVQQ